MIMSSASFLLFPLIIGGFVLLLDLFDSSCPEYRDHFLPQIYIPPSKPVVIKEDLVLPFSSYHCSGPSEGADAHLFRTCNFQNLYVFDEKIYFYYNEKVWSEQQMKDQRDRYFTTQNIPTGLDGSSKEWGHRWAPELTTRIPESKATTEHRPILYFTPGDTNNFGHALMDDILSLLMAYERVLLAWEDKPLCLVMINSRFRPPAILKKIGRELVAPDFAMDFLDYFNQTAGMKRLKSFVAGTGSTHDHPPEKTWDQYRNGRMRGALGFAHGYSPSWFRIFRWLARDIPSKPENRNCSVVYLNKGQGAHTRPVRDFSEHALPGEKVISPHEMSLKDQVSLIGHADVVVSNCGGGSLISMFAGILTLKRRSSVVLVCGGGDGRLDYMSFDEAVWIHPIWYDTERADCCATDERLRALVNEARSYSCSK